VPGGLQSAAWLSAHRLWGTGKFILGSAGARCLICYVRLRMDQTAGAPIAQGSADKARAKQKGL